MTFTRALFWFSVRVRTRYTWCIYLSTPRLSPLLTTLHCEGYTQPVSRQVVIDVRYPWERVANAILPHELAHVAADERDIEDAEFEETIVRALSIPYFDMLSRHPFELKSPKRPKEYSKFRRWALKVDPWE